MTETEIPNNMTTDFDHLVDSISKDLSNINKGFINEDFNRFNFRNGIFTFDDGILNMVHSLSD